MRIFISFFILTTLIFSASSTAASVTTETEQARSIAMQLQQRLGQELKAGIQAGGPRAGIQVCKERAPEIAAELSQQHGIEVGRTALRVRNPNNAPASIHRDVLEDFIDRLADDPNQVPETWVTTDSGERHYLRAIVMQPQCVLCHGKMIGKPVQQALDEFYPDDQATGFAIGDLRGAFLLKFPLTND